MWKDKLSSDGKILDLSNSELTNFQGERLPAGIVELNLSFTSLNSLDGIELPSSLVRLDLWGTKITSLEGINLPTNLQYLDLGSTPITDLSGVCFPEGIREINLMASEIRSLSGVVLPKNLESLNMWGTFLTDVIDVDFPDGLRTLVLSNTKLSSLSGARLPTGLHDLYLDDTEITDIDGVAFPDGLQRLYLSNTGIESISGVVLPTELRELGLDNTKIRCLEGVHLPDKLHSLILRCSPIESLANIDLPQLLHTLDLCGTNLPNLENVRIPSGLQVLELGDTIIQDLRGAELPTDLHTLGLSISLLSNLGIGALPAGLVELYLSCSEVATLPNSIRSLKNLRKLELSELILTDLPDWLPELNLPFTLEKRADGICLGDTTVEGVDMSIFSQSQEAILQWFDARKSGGETPLNEIKVVFLGNGDVGKSYTIARLLQDGKKPDDTFTGNSTPGIAISDKNYAIDGEEIRVHFWDFGGQDILYSMHRMFLTERTIYVVMVDARNESRGSQAREWLDTIKSFAGDAPILLAVNKLDQNPGATLDERILMTEYPNLKKIIKFSALNEEEDGFNQIFTESMLDLIRKSDVPKMKWPQRWKLVKDELQKMEAPYIRSSDYERICQDCNVTVGGNGLLSWCNDLGVCFCREDKQLKDYVILRPEWITNAIYTILFNKRDTVRNGLISLNEISDLLNSSESLQVQKSIRYTWADMIYVLDVVRKFSLSYPVDRHTEFFPMLCSENSSPIVQEYAEAQDTLEFHMEFDYLPNNVLHRLMVERHQELDPNNVWLTGARFFQKDLGLSAVVKIDGNRLILYVRSDNPQVSSNTYLSVISGSVDRIRNELGLPPTEKRLVYKLDGRQHVFDYEELLKMRDDGAEKAYASSFEKNRRWVPIVEVLHQSGPAPHKEQEQLLEDMVKLCADLQAEKLYWGSEEDDRNRYLRNGLNKMTYIVLDQTQRGIAGGERRAGELDLDIRKYKDVPWTVCEALRIKDGAKSDWNKHLDKLLDNYNPNGLQFLVLLTYVDAEKEQFDEIWKSYKTHIRSHDAQRFSYKNGSLVLFTSEPWTGNHYIKTARCTYVLGDYHPVVYHIFVRMGR